MGLADLVLAPGLAVDASGTRMGQGGGCYDRALPRRRPGVPVVVLLHPGELLGGDDEPLPRDPHDQPVDAVLTAASLTDLPASCRPDHHGALVVPVAPAPLGGPGGRLVRPQRQHLGVGVVDRPRG